MPCVGSDISGHAHLLFFSYVSLLVCVLMSPHHDAMLHSVSVAYPQYRDLGLPITHFCDGRSLQLKIAQTH